MFERLLIACTILCLAALGTIALLRPRSLLRRERIPRALGLTVGARVLLTRVAGAALLAVSFVLWLGFVGG